MTLLRSLAISTLLVAGVAGAATTAADAEPFAAPAPMPAASQATPVGAYGQVPGGLYGSRTRFRTRRSYGTGYRGRGTKTGGPSGGLPGRS